MKTTWILQAMSAGGKLVVGATKYDPMHYQALMWWPHCPMIKGPECRSVEHAVETLNDALQEDCAKEMLESGAA